jgi:TetR/AcrR family tetracycline transcriptional repressor
MSKTQKGKYQNKNVYLNAAFDIIKEVGVDKLTMRKVADQLDVSPMYKHFANKDELLKAVLDEFIARADILPADELPWDQWVSFVAKGMFRALQGETSWLPLLGTFDVGDNALQVTLSFVNKLMAAGFSFAQALEAYLAMIHLVIGAVTLQSTMGRGNQALLDSIAGTGSISTKQLKQTIFQDQIDIGLPLLIEALRGRVQYE